MRPRVRVLEYPSLKLKLSLPSHLMPGLGGISIEHDRACEARLR
jgi:hypothetical protein